jgi:hypothetical protein
LFRGSDERTGYQPDGNTDTGAYAKPNSGADNDEATVDISARVPGTTDAEADATASISAGAPDNTDTGTNGASGSCADSDSELTILRKVV